MLLAGGLAHGAARPPPRQTRDLGRVEGFGETLLVPAEGLRFEFLAVPPPRTRRTSVVTEATGRAENERAVVRLRMTVAGVLMSPSSRDCFERNIREPPFVECTALATAGWNDGRARRVVLTIDNLVRSPVTIRLRVVIMDPHER
jgi:hypothetical protein